MTFDMFAVRAAADAYEGIWSQLVQERALIAETASALALLVLCNHLGVRHTP